MISLYMVIIFLVGVSVGYEAAYHQIKKGGDNHANSSKEQSKAKE
jgi:hypothetical protein